MSFNKEMMKALWADAEKLGQLTGEDHGPAFLGEPCLWPDCECIKHGTNCLADYIQQSPPRGVKHPMIEKFSMTIATALWQAWVEMNAIRARDGVPYQSEAGGVIYKSSVSPDYWSRCVDDLAAAYQELTGFEIMPWSPSVQFRDRVGGVVKP